MEEIGEITEKRSKTFSSNTSTLWLPGTMYPVFVSHRSLRRTSLEQSSGLAQELLGLAFFSGIILGGRRRSDFRRFSPPPCSCLWTSAIRRCPVGLVGGASHLGAPRTHVFCIPVWHKSSASYFLYVELGLGPYFVWRRFLLQQHG